MEWRLVVQCNLLFVCFFSGGEVAEMVTKFSSMRGSFPPVVLATPHDKLPAPWTTNSAPSQPVLLRLQLLARESLSLLTEKLSQSMHSTSLEDIKVRVKISQQK